MSLNVTLKYTDINNQTSHTGMKICKDEIDYNKSKDEHKLYELCSLVEQYILCSYRKKDVKNITINIKEGE